MTTLLNLLAAIALLVWGTHIVRTGVLRVYGAVLRKFLARSMDGRATAFFADATAFQAAARRLAF